MATNQQKFDKLTDQKFFWQAQLPLNAGDKAFHGTKHSAEHLLYLAKFYAQEANTRATRLEKSLAAQNASVANLVSALAAVSKGEPFDQAKLLAGVQEASRKGVSEAMADLTVTVSGKDA